MSIDSKNNTPVILLFGPTAVGKTRLITQIFAGTAEIINADSMQVYKGMDIGTAKPDSALLDLIPHHLIDLLNPDEQFDLGNFIRTAERLIIEIQGRGKIPVISGGTAFYFKHFLFGLPDAPKSDLEVRKQLRKEMQDRGPESLHKELAEVDPISAKRISFNDIYRVIRALEVYRATGQPLSSYSPVKTPRSDITLYIVGLFRDRDELNDRIDARVDVMFSQGLVEEVRQLIARGYSSTDPGMRAIGYREFFIMKEAGCMTLEDVKDTIKRHSRQYAKRQMTFFKTLPGVTWIHPDSIHSLAELKDYCLK